MMSDPRTTAGHNDWMLGFAAALGAAIRLHDLPTVARSVMDGDGITVADLKHAGV